MFYTTQPGGFYGGGMGNEGAVNPSMRFQQQPLPGTSNLFNAIPGATNPLMAGSPGYMPSDQEIQNRLFQYGMQNTPQGQQIRTNIERLQKQYPNIFGAPGRGV